MSQVVSRGTITIDVAACKGCELCIVACPPKVLVMSEDVNDAGYLYPQLLEGCTGCSACKEICPDYVFEVFRFTPPAAGVTASTGGSTRWN